MIMKATPTRRKSIIFCHYAGWNNTNVAILSLLFTMTMMMMMLSCHGFVSPTQRAFFGGGGASKPLISERTRIVVFMSGKGFGKPLEKSESKKERQQPSSSSPPPEDDDEGVGGGEEDETFSGGLQSISDESSTTPTTTTNTNEIDIDPNLNPEERAEQVLRQKFGLQSALEQKGDLEAARREAERAKQIKSQRSQLNEIRSMSDEEFDLMRVLPPSLIKAIDLFLKVGASICIILFVLAGIALTVEAWSTVSQNDFLPPDVDDFIVNVVGPNFTPGLLVLLGFSISLGFFATAQMGSGETQYKED